MSSMKKYSWGKGSYEQKRFYFNLSQAETRYIRAWSVPCVKGKVVLLQAMEGIGGADV
jgi:hypothetical protein